MERLFFDPLLNNYVSLAKEIGIASATQVREWDIGIKSPSETKSQRKIMEILYRKREALNQIIQEYEKLRRMEKWLESNQG